MKKVIFGLLTYNQERYILETLESIKYQKIHYGEDLEVSLIITDDASKDRTVYVMQQWLEKNSAYFSEIRLIANAENKGTVENFRTIMQEANGDCLKILAGDDLISSENLFEEYEDLTEKELKTYMRVELCDGKIYCREKYLINFYYHMKYGRDRKYYLKNFRRGKFLHTPSTLYTKRLFENTGCDQALEGYRLFEDDPMWYCMLKNEAQIKVRFVPRGIVLYRIHKKSVSNVPNPVFRKDVKKLREMYLTETKGTEKMYHMIRLHFHNMPMYLNPGLYVDKLINVRRELVCKKDPEYALFKKNIHEQIVCEQKYYTKLLEEIEKQHIG